MDEKSKSPGAGMFARAYGTFVRASSCLQSPLLLAIRLYWGWQFYVAGKPKLADVDKFTVIFEKFHIPMPRANVLLVGWVECIGGLLLAAGLGARAVGAVLAIDMIVAYLTADLDSVKHIWNDSDKFVSAAPFLFLLASLIVVAFGPGCISIDAAIKRMRGSDPAKVS